MASGVLPLSRVPKPGNVGDLTSFIEQVNHNFLSLVNEINTAYGSKPSLLYVQPMGGMMDLARVNFEAVRVFILANGGGDMGPSIEPGPLNQARLNELNNAFLAALESL